MIIFDKVVRVTQKKKESNRKSVSNLMKGNQSQLMHILKEKVFKIRRPLLNSLSELLKLHKDTNLMDIFSLNVIIDYNYRYENEFLNVCLNVYIERKKLAKKFSSKSI